MATPVPTSSRDERTERIFLGVVRLAKAYWYVLMIFVGGMAGTFLGGFIVPFLPLPASWTGARTTHTLWMVGAVVVAIGTPLGWFRRRKTASTVTQPSQATEPVDQPIEEVTVTIDRSAGNALRTGVSTGLVCLILGFLLGGTLALMWFSAASSPFAPDEWAQSIKWGRRIIGTSSRTRMLGGFGTSNPIPFILWFGTAGVLGVFGFFFGLIGAPLGWITDETSKKLTRRVRPESRTNSPSSTKR